jgi:hypothetical protein
MKEKLGPLYMFIATSNSPSPEWNCRVLFVGEIGPDETIYLSS